MVAQLAIAPEGLIAAARTPDRIVVLGLPGGALYGEIGVPPLEAGESRRFAWVGNHLLVATRRASHTDLLLLEPTREHVRELAELRVDAPMTLAAAVGEHALLAGDDAATVFADGAPPALHPIPGKLSMKLTGAAGDRFVTGHGSWIDEWNPTLRKPGRRLQVPGGAELLAVGGSARLVWMIAARAPHRVHVIQLVHRNQPRLHELPAAISEVVSHPQHDLIACIAADRRQIFLVDLDRSPSRWHSFTPDERDPIAALAIDRGRAHLVAIGESGSLASFALAPEGFVVRRVETA